jgi:hypothetical protein
MIDAGYRKPYVHVAAHACPADGALVAPPRETPLPHMRDFLSELWQSLGVSRHAIVPIVPHQHRTEPGSLRGHGLLSAPL